MPPRSRATRSRWQRFWLGLRLQRRRTGRRTPEWLRQSLPWITSLVLHVVLLVILALIVRYAGDEGPPPTSIRGQLTDDVTALEPGDRSGDPFTTLDAVEPPSLPSSPDAIDPTALNIPDFGPNVTLAPEFNLEPDAPAADLGDGPERPVLGGSSRQASGLKPGEASVPFTGRRGPMKARLVRREGGTVESEAAVERGLDWIARHQRPDGGWSLDTRNACTTPACPDRPAMTSDTAATGLALLPLLGAGHSHLEPGRYQQTIGNGLRWLVEAQGPDGSLFLGGTTHAALYSHAIATMALGEAFALTHDKRLRAPLQRAVGFIARSQHFAGGWRYEPLMPGDTSVHGWMLFALRSADLAGVSVPKRTVRLASKYLESVATDKSRTTYGYMTGLAPTMSMTAEALVCRQLLGWRRENAALQRGVDGIAAHLQESTERNIYYWYYATQLLHNMNDKRWQQWNARVRDGLIGLQVGGEGCDRGSWDPGAPQEDVWGLKAGRLFTTSLSLLTLEVYYRYLPLYRDRGGALEPEDEPSASERSKTGDPAAKATSAAGAEP